MAGEVLVNSLSRPADWNVGLPTLPVDSHGHVTVAALFFVVVKSAPAVSQPFSKCCAFHCYGSGTIYQSADNRGAMRLMRFVTGPNAVSL
jgi:hypothetical protein